MVFRALTGTLGTTCSTTSGTTAGPDRVGASAAEARGVVSLDRQLRVIRDLERSGRLDRTLEFLPDDETLAARSAQGRGLVRPELAVLLAYAKMTLYETLLASALPDAADLVDELRS